MKAIIPIAAVTLAACASVPPAPTGPTAGFGEAAVSNGVQFRPLQLLEDSRCPTNVQCVWAGRLVVRTAVSGAGWQQVRDLELGVPQAVAEYRVALIGAEPQKQAGAEIDPRAYRFTFTASGR